LRRQNENLKIDLSKEFYKSLPFVGSIKKPINNKRTLCQRFDLCQMLRDMISIGEETNWNMRTSIQSMYRSMGAFISHLSKESDDYNELNRLVYSKGLKSNASILNVYEVRRLDESSNFNRQVFILIYLMNFFSFKKLTIISHAVN
jgi:hypothetical protein